MWQNVDMKSSALYKLFFISDSCRSSSYQTFSKLQSAVKRRTSLTQRCRRPPQTGITLRVPTKLSGAKLRVLFFQRTPRIPASKPLIPSKSPIQYAAWTFSLNYLIIPQVIWTLKTTHGLFEFHTLGYFVLVCQRSVWKKDCEKYPAVDHKLKIEKWGGSISVINWSGGKTACTKRIWPLPWGRACWKPVNVILLSAFPELQSACSWIWFRVSFMSPVVNEGKGLTEDEADPKPENSAVAHPDCCCLTWYHKPSVCFVALG